MIFSNAAVVLLGALQPALGKPALLHRAELGSENQLLAQWLTATETVINFFAPNPGCGKTKPWVGVWPINNFDTASMKTWQYVEPTKGRKAGSVKFNNTELGVGDYVALFSCEDHAPTSPWMMSEMFTVDMAPPEKKGQCVHRQTRLINEWTYTACDKVSVKLCYDCAFSDTCVACSDCKDQCGLTKDY